MKYKTEENEKLKIEVKDLKELVKLGKNQPENDVYMETIRQEKSENYENIKQKSVKAYKRFKSEIENKIYPETKHDIEISDDEFSNFIKNK